MTDKLTLYNSTLRKLKERKLASLAEAREARRVMDDVYTDTVAYCLEQGLWLFAKRAIKTDASTTVVPAFGYNYAFVIPKDWIRTILVSNAPALDPPLLQYHEETGFWYANGTPLYVTYVSNDPLYGMNLGTWPQSFAEYVACRMAWAAAPRLAKDERAIERLLKDETMARRVSKANDAMNEPPGLPPVSMWVRSRRGAFSGGISSPSGNNG